MTKGIEKLLEPPFEGNTWLKEGEKISVRPGHTFELSHTAPEARTKIEAITKEVREYLLSKSVSEYYSTGIWFGEELCGITITIGKTKGIQVKYKME